jgi:predicted nucleic acid-binding protein
VRRVLLDVNVVLDVLLDRKPFADASAAVWAAIENGDAEGLLSAHAVTTLHYLNVKAVGTRMATETTEALLSVFNVAPVDEAVLRSAVSLQWQDFEDAVTAAGSKPDLPRTVPARRRESDRRRSSGSTSRLPPS